MLFVIVSTLAKSQVLKEGEINLTDQLHINSALLSNVLDTISFFNSHRLQIELMNPDSVGGYIYFQNLLMQADSWQLKTQHRTISSDSLLSVWYVPPFKGSALLSFEVREIDRMEAQGLQVWFASTSHYNDQVLLRYSTQSFFIGVFLFLAVFNLMQGVVTKWSLYFRYSAYILSVAIYMLFYFGIVQEYFPWTRSISINVLSYLYSLIFVLYFVFIKDLGDYKRTAPRAHHLLRIGIIYQAAQIVFELAAHLFQWEVIHSAAYEMIFLVLEVGLMLAIIWYIVRARNFRGRLVIAGSSVLILSAILAQLDIGVDRAYILECGVFLEMLTFSVGIGYISKRYFDERDEARNLYIKQLEENRLLSERLEKELGSMVSERTRALYLEKEAHRLKSEENKVLLQEVHHRVKNNLQMIISLLSMQERRLTNEDALEVLGTTKNKIKSISLIHKYLYDSDTFTEIKLNKYVSELTQTIIDSFGEDKSIVTELDLHAESVNLDDALFIGIIINELITNSIKHAIQGDSRLLVMIQLEMESDKAIITIADNGPGISSDFTDGLGYGVIRALTGLDDRNLVHFTDKKGYFNVKVHLPLSI